MGVSVLVLLEMVDQIVIISNTKTTVYMVYALKTAFTLMEYVSFKNFS